MKKYKRFGDERVLKRHVGGETVLVPYHANLADMTKLYFLDPVAEFLWDRLENPADASALAEMVCTEFDVAHDEALRDVDRFVCELQAAGLAEVS